MALLASNDVTRNLAIIGRCGEGKTIAAKTFIQYQHLVNQKRFIIISPDRDYNSFVDHHGGTVYQFQTKLMYTNLNALSYIALPRNGPTMERALHSVLTGLYLSLPSLKGKLDFIVIDEGQSVLNGHFDLFMDCLKIANENGIRIVIILQMVSSILNVEQLVLFAKSFNEMLAFHNYDENFQDYTKNLKTHEAVHYLGKTKQMHVLRFDPSEVVY